MYISRIIYQHNTKPRNNSLFLLFRVMSESRRAIFTGRSVQEDYPWRILRAYKDFPTVLSTLECAVYPYCNDTNKNCNVIYGKLMQILWTSLYYNFALVTQTLQLTSQTGYNISLVCITTHKLKTINKLHKMSRLWRSSRKVTNIEGSFTRTRPRT